MICVHVSKALEDDMLQLIFATRMPVAYGDALAEMIAFGASPRGPDPVGWWSMAYG